MSGTPYPRMLWRAPTSHGLEPKSAEIAGVSSFLLYVILLVLTGAFFFTIPPVFIFYKVLTGMLAKKNEEDTRFFEMYSWSISNRNKVLVPKRITKADMKVLKRMK